MHGEEMRPLERMDSTPRRWAVFVILTAIALMLVTYGVYTSQAAIPIEQVECASSGQPAFGILPPDGETVDIYHSNILNMVGCMGDIDTATPEGTPVPVPDHGLTEPLALH